MKYYNYRINYDSGATTEIIKADTKIDAEQILKEKGVYVMNVKNINKTMTINTSHIVYIEEWETEDNQ